MHTPLLVAFHNLEYYGMGGTLHDFGAYGL